MGDCHTAYNGYVNLLRGVTNVVNGVDNLAGGLVNTVNGVVGTVGNTVNGVVGGVGQTVNGVVGTVGNVVNGAVGAVGNVAGGLLGILSDEELKEVSVVYFFLNLRCRTTTYDSLDGLSRTTNKFKSLTQDFTLNSIISLQALIIIDI
jgi:hypothetical protein